MDPQGSAARQFYQRSACALPEPEENLVLFIFAQNRETFGIFRFRAEKNRCRFRNVGRAVAGPASKTALTRSRRVEIGRNMGHRIRAYELYGPSENVATDARRRGKPRLTACFGPPEREGLLPRRANPQPHVRHNTVHCTDHERCVCALGSTERRCRACHWASGTGDWVSPAPRAIPCYPPSPVTPRAQTELRCIQCGRTAGAQTCAPQNKGSSSPTPTVTRAT